MSATLRQALAAHPFLEGLPEGTVDLVEGCARPVTFPAGSLLLREGQVADTLYLLEAGRVAIEVHGPARGRVVIETVGPGHVVGLSWVAPPYRWHFDARALEPVRAIAVDSGGLRAALAGDPAAGYALLGRLSSVLIGRLQATRVRLLDLYGDDPH